MKYLADLAGVLMKIARDISKATPGSIKEQLPMNAFLSLLIIQYAVAACIAGCAGAWASARAKEPAASAENFATVVALAGIPTEENALIMCAMTVSNLLSISPEAYAQLEKDAAKKDAVAQKILDVLALLKGEVFML